MTVCIAAICLEDGSIDEPRIILVSDWRGSTVLGHKDIYLKQRHIGHGWMMAASGKESDIAGLRIVLRRRFKDGPVPTGEKIDSTIAGALNEYRRQKCTEYTQGRFSISYDEFLDFGRAKLDQAEFHDALKDIGAITVDVDLIIAGFIDGQPELYKTNGNTRARANEDYVVVGEGEHLATASLIERGQMGTLRLVKTLYNAFEAKRTAERIASVGPRTSLLFLHPERHRSFFLGGEELQDKLQSLYDSYGSRPAPQADDFDSLGALLERDLRELYEKHHPSDDGSADSEAEG